MSPSLEVSDEDWEDICADSGGWEWIDLEAKTDGKNEFDGMFGAL